MTPRRRQARREGARDKRRGKEVLDECIANSFGLTLAGDAHTPAFRGYDRALDKAAFDAQAVALDDLLLAREFGISLRDTDGAIAHLDAIPHRATGSYPEYLRKKARAYAEAKEARKAAATGAAVIVWGDAADERYANRLGITLYDDNRGRYALTPLRSTVSNDKKELLLQAEAANDAQLAARLGISLYGPDGAAVRLNAIPKEPKVYKLDPAKAMPAKKYTPTRPVVSSERFEALKDARDEAIMNCLGITLAEDPADRRTVVSPKSSIPAKRSELLLQAEAANDAQLAARLGISLYGDDGVLSPLDKISSVERMSYATGLREKSIQSFTMYLSDHRIPVDDKMACLLGYVRAAQRDKQLDAAFTREVCATALATIHDTSVPRDDRESYCHAHVRGLRDQLWRKSMFDDAPTRFLYFRERFEKISPDILDHQLANL